MKKCYKDYDFSPYNRERQVMQLHHRRDRSDAIETWNILSGKVTFDPKRFLTRQQGNKTQRQEIKLFQVRKMQKKINNIVAIVSKRD